MEAAVEEGHLGFGCSARPFESCSQIKFHRDLHGSQLEICGVWDASLDATPPDLKAAACISGKGPSSHRLRTSKPAANSSRRKNSKRRIATVLNVRDMTSS